MDLDENVINVSSETMKSASVQLQGVVMSRRNRHLRRASGLPIASSKAVLEREPEDEAAEGGETPPIPARSVDSSDFDFLSEERVKDIPSDDDVIDEVD